MDIVARNIIMLLLLYTSSVDDEQIVECVLHVWYSTLLKQSDFDRLLAVRKLIEDVCTKAKEEHLNSILVKTWKFSNNTGSLRVILSKSDWMKLMSYLEVPRGLDPKAALRIRSTIMNAPSRIDYAHRSLYNKLKPSWRQCEKKFRDDGLMVPFGMPRNTFVVPNP